MVPAGEARANTKRTEVLPILCLRAARVNRISTAASLSDTTSYVKHNQPSKVPQAERLLTWLVRSEIRPFAVPHTGRSDEGSLTARLALA